jgi:hypothetical protein
MFATRTVWYCSNLAYLVAGASFNSTGNNIIVYTQAASSVISLQPSISFSCFLPLTHVSICSLHFSLFPLADLNGDSQGGIVRTVNISQAPITATGLLTKYYVPLPGSATFDALQSGGVFPDQLGLSLFLLTLLFSHYISLSLFNIGTSAVLGGAADIGAVEVVYGYFLLLLFIFIPLNFLLNLMCNFKGWSWSLFSELNSNFH